MHMYKLIIDLLNNFLNYIHIPDFLEELFGLA